MDVAGAASGGFSAEEELKLGLETASAANGGHAPYDGEQDVLVDLVSRNIVACLEVRRHTDQAQSPGFPLIKQTPSPHPLLSMNISPPLSLPLCLALPCANPQSVQLLPVMQGHQCILGLGVWRRPKWSSPSLVHGDLGTSEPSGQGGVK